MSGFSWKQRPHEKICKMWTWKAALFLVRTQTCAMPELGICHYKSLGWNIKGSENMSTERKGSAWRIRLWYWGLSSVAFSSVTHIMILFLDSWPYGPCGRKQGKWWSICKNKASIKHCLLSNILSAKLTGYLWRSSGWAQTLAIAAISSSFSSGLLPTRSLLLWSSLRCPLKVLFPNAVARVSWSLAWLRSL